MKGIDLRLLEDGCEMDNVDDDGNEGERNGERVGAFPAHIDHDKN